MPFKSDRQRRFMYAQHPGIARRWTAEEKEVGKMQRYPSLAARGRRVTSESVTKVATSELERGLAQSRKTLAAASREVENHIFRTAKVPAPRKVPRSFSMPMQQGQLTGGVPGVKSARYYDPEDYRQRRQGYVEGAAATGGGVLLARGGRQMRAERKEAEALIEGVKGNSGNWRDAVRLAESVKGRKIVSLSKPGAGRVAVGAGLLGGAMTLNRYGASRRNQRYR